MKQMIAGLTLALALTPALFAAAPAKPAMMPECMAMMKDHDAMQKHMAEMDSKMRMLVADMNQATGSAKVDKTAAVVTELVAQRSMMQKQMMEMHPKMMGHMQSHMKGGSMSSCPMMSGTTKPSASPAAPHKH